MWWRTSLESTLSLIVLEPVLLSVSRRTTISSSSVAASPATVASGSIGRVLKILAVSLLPSRLLRLLCLLLRPGIDWPWDVLRSIVHV